MIEEQDRIVAVEGAFAWVESERSTACGACSARGGCGTSVLARVFGRRRVNLRALNRPGAEVGDAVVIGIAESGLVRGSLAVYAAPLAGLLAGALAGDALGAALAPAPTDLPAIAGALAGLAAGLLWLRRFSERTGQDEGYQPVILRRQTLAESVQDPGREASPGS